MQRRSVCVDVLETPVLHSLPWDRLDLITVVFFSTFRQTFGERQNHNNRKKKFLFLLSHLLSIPAYSSYGILVFKYRSVWWPPPQGPCPLPRQHVCLFGATPLFFFPCRLRYLIVCFYSFSFYSMSSLAPMSQSYDDQAPQKMSFQVKCIDEIVWLKKLN